MSTKPAPLRRFMPYLLRYKGILLFDLFCAALTCICELVLPLMVRTVTNMGAENPAGLTVGFIVRMGALYGVLRLVDAAANYFMANTGHVMGARIETDMRRDLFRHLQSLSFRFYDTHRTGSLMSRVVSDLFEVVELAHHGPEDLFISFVTLTGSLIVMFTIRWELALVITLLVPLLIGFTVLRRTHMGAASRAVKEKIAVINTGIESSISGIRTAKAFTNESYERERFQAGSEQYRAARRSFYKQMGIFGAGNDVLTNLMNVAVIAAGGLLIIDG